MGNVKWKLVECLGFPEGVAGGNEGAASDVVDIQYMPPGRHDIVSTNPVDGKPKQLTVTVDEAVAAKLKMSLDQYLAKAAGGSGDVPYIDFNHHDGPAAGHVQELYWGGDDPAKGGVRAKVRLTQPGLEAIQGRAYRRFSPSFYVDDSNNIRAASLNMGGLVNRAAFRDIEAIWSRGAEPCGENGGVMSTNSSSAASGSTELEALRAELAAARAENETLKQRLGDQALVTAKAAVQAAIDAGRLAPQATAVHEKWTQLCAREPQSIELLQALPVTVAVPGRITQGAGPAPKPEDKQPKTAREQWSK